MTHLGEEDVSHGSAAHGRPRVSRHGLLHDVSCQHTDRVHSLHKWNTSVTHIMHTHGRGEGREVGRDKSLTRVTKSYLLAGTKGRREGGRSQTPEAATLHTQISVKNISAVPGTQ